MVLDTIIFDFDGVIAESVDVKTKAFRKLFKDYPDKLSVIERYHLDNGGISRFDKFRHIYKNILGKELSEIEFSRLCCEFNKLVVEDVIKAPFVDGVKNFLDSYNKKLPLYVVSATPEGEIKEIVRRKDIEAYFLGVYGSPETKDKLIKNIILENNYEPEKTLFIGDSKNDHDAARKAGILFAARVIDKNQEWSRKPDITTVFTEFNQLRNYIEAKIEKRR